MNFLWTNQIESQTYKDALSIRWNVFVNEQQVPADLEIDDLEDKTWHLVLYIGEHPAGTARILEEAPGIYKVQRVAVLSLFRGQGLGRAVMEETERKIRHLGGVRMLLDAQLHAIPFYETLGFTAEGGEFMDAGIPHRKMQKEVS